MRSVQNEEPAEATADELEELLEDREQTLLEWYDRSLIDPSTFDEESRQRMQEVIDDSEGIFGSEADIREFVRRGLEMCGGQLEKTGQQLFTVQIPAELSETGVETERGPVTFSRAFAMDHEGIEYLSPDDPLVQRLQQWVLADDRGEVGLKMLPFVDAPGITFVYRVVFEDGTGETVREELVPVFVDLASANPRRPVGERVLDAETVQAAPDQTTVRNLIEDRERLETEAERYIAKVVRNVQRDLDDSRTEEIEQQRANLENYRTAERERIKAFIEQYEQQAAAGQDMEISIRNQRQRLEQLEERIEERQADLDRRARIISVAPEVEAYCLTLPV
jgi:hypothetical protein